MDKMKLKKKNETNKVFPCKKKMKIHNKISVWFEKHTIVWPRL